MKTMVEVEYREKFMESCLLNRILAGRILWMKMGLLAPMLALM
nr:MAG TPA: hypothetical protein [Caudoviricetes sp.]